MKTYVYGLLTGFFLPLLFALLLGLSGRVPVAATDSEPAPLRWFIHHSFEQAVARGAEGISPPPDLDDPARVASGARSFAAMCAGCHTPPGLTDTPRTIGLNPPPPRLASLAGHHDAAQTFWVIRNGARMTGMPAFGPTHENEALWDLTAFVQSARELDPARYRSLSAGPVDDGHDHRHGDGEHTHSEPELEPARAVPPGHEGHDHEH